MKMQVLDCKKSYKFTNVWAVTYQTTKVDFFTGAEETAVHTIFSKVPVEPGLRDVVKGFNEDKSKFWIEEVKA